MQSTLQSSLWNQIEKVWPKQTNKVIILNIFGIILLSKQQNRADKTIVVEGQHLVSMIRTTAILFFTLTTLMWYTPTVPETNDWHSTGSTLHVESLCTNRYYRYHIPQIPQVCHTEKYSEMDKSMEYVCISVHMHMFVALLHTCVGKNIANCNIISVYTKKTLKSLINFILGFGFVLSIGPTWKDDVHTAPPQTPWASSPYSRQGKSHFGRFLEDSVQVTLWDFV